MKNKILIIEDDYGHFFTLKQMLESQLKLRITIFTANTIDEIMNMTTQFRPQTTLMRTVGGAMELVERLKKRHVNRLNSEIALLAISEQVSKLDLLQAQVKSRKAA